METKTLTAERETWEFVDVEAASRASCRLCGIVKTAVIVLPCCKFAACRECLESLKTSLCVNCGEAFDATSEDVLPTPDPAWRELVEGLVVKCPRLCGYKGCMKEFMGEPESHAASCPKVKVPCSRDCGIMLPRGELESHAATCPKSIVPCPISP